MRSIQSLQRLSSLEGDDTNHFYPGDGIHEIHIAIVQGSVLWLQNKNSHLEIRRIFIDNDRLLADSEYHFMDNNPDYKIVLITPEETFCALLSYP